MLQAFLIKKYASYSSSLFAYETCEESFDGDGLELTTCIPRPVETGNTDRFADQLQITSNTLYWAATVLAVGAVATVGIRIIFSRLSNDPAKSAKAIQSLGFIFLGLLLAGSAVTIAGFVF